MTKENIAQLDVVPGTLIWMTADDDFLGTELTFLEKRHNAYYYVSYRGSNSTIKTMSSSRIREIIRGEDKEFFSSISQLHDRVLELANKTIECIDRFRETGQYFEREID